jgi:parvulin-like peptidyl-prolyl isomerase
LRTFGIRAKLEARLQETEMKLRIRIVFVLALTLTAGCRCGSLEPQKGGGKAGRASKRDKIRKPQQRKFLAGAMILIAYKGAKDASPKVTRTKAEAQRLARDLAVRLKEQPGIFDEVARKHSDGPYAKDGGFLGAWTRGRMPKELEAALDRLKIGGVSDVLETPAGFQILHRKIAVLAGSQILISWRGAPGAHRMVTRNRIQAKALAKEISDKTRASPAQFGALARQHSDDKATGRRGGRLGVWPRGRKPAIIERTLDRLELDQVSIPVEDRRGFYVLKREDPYPNR